MGLMSALYRPDGVLDYESFMNQAMNMTPQPVIPHSDEYFRENYNTPIPADKQQQFSKWAFDTSRKLGRDITQDNIDYDVNGAALDNMKTSANGHGSDKFKKPNHPTFSNQSQYSGVDGYSGGNWDKTLNGYSFTPSETNKIMWSPDSMARYFQKVEPDNALMENVGGRIMNVNIPAIIGLLNGVPRG